MQGLLVRRPPRTIGLGDITADLSALVSLASSAGSPGGIGAWMQNQITQLNALPNVVANLQGIITTLNSALTAAGLVPSTVMGMTQAQADLTNITAGFPTVQSNLGVIGVTLYPALASGSFGLATLTALAAQGSDVVGTFNGMQQLFAYRDDARAQLASVAANPAIPLATQQSVMAALNNLGVLGTSSSTGIGTFLLWGVGGFVAYKLVRMFV